MAEWLTRRRVLVLTAASAVALAIAIPGGANGVGPTILDTFERIPAEATSPSGNSALVDCQSSEVGTETWPDASADLRIHQAGGESDVVVTLKDAVPNEYFTIWLRLGGNDSNGDPYGRNPVTGGRATPLAHTSDLPVLLAATGSGNGNDEVPNGFHTDSSGNARFSVNLDFPVVGGAYPFQRFPDWDPTDERLAAENPAIHPVAVAGPQGPFTLRVVSHCTDDVGHGLGSGPRELWFDWTVDE